MLLSYIRHAAQNFKYHSCMLVHAHVAHFDMPHAMCFTRTLVHALAQIMKLSERSVSGVAHVNVQGGDAPVRVSSGPLLGITTKKQLSE